jgi:DNA transposition AAA+ family ATPase
MVSHPANSLPTEAQASENQDAARALQNVGDTVRAGWRFSLDAVRSNIAYMSPEAKELLVWAFTWSIDHAHPIRFEEFCSRIGYDSNTVYKAYSGKLRHPTQKDANGQPVPMDLSAGMLKELRAFRRIELQRAKLGRNLFVETPTARRVFLACDLARESQTPVFIEGASHVGKTEAFRQYCIENNHGRSVLVELEAVSGLMGVVRAIAAKLGISPNGNTPDLIERIRKALTPDMVLILDEVHLLANTYRRGSYFACMEAIRRIYDFCQCGLVLSFTKLGYDRAEKERKRELEQIFRRGVHRVNLGDRPTAEDVRLIVEAWGLEMPARNDQVEVTIHRKVIAERPWAMLAQLAGEAGLKAIVERLRYASKFAADAETKLAWEHVVRAHFTVLKNAQQPDHGWSEKGGAL